MACCSQPLARVGVFNLRCKEARARRKEAGGCQSFREALLLPSFLLLLQPLFLHAVFLWHAHGGVLGECEVKVLFRVPVCERGTLDAVSPDYSSVVACSVRGGLNSDFCACELALVQPDERVEEKCGLVGCVTVPTRAHWARTSSPWKVVCSPRSVIAIFFGLVLHSGNCGFFLNALPRALQRTTCQHCGVHSKATPHPPPSYGLLIGKLGGFRLFAGPVQTTLVQ